MHRFARPWLLLVPGLAALLWRPLRWLVETWTDPAWGSPGGWVALAAAALVVRSLRSGRAPVDPGATRLAARLLLLTAAVRLVGQVAAVNLVGALALVVDVGALATALRLHRRPWAVSPVALATLFAFSLPLEQALQRVLGFPLRWLSATLAHAALAPFDDALARTGTLLHRAGLTLSVDLPCSGAQGLVLLGVVAAGIAARRRPSVPALGLSVVGGALLANVARIVGLYAGARLELGLEVEPGHSLLGLAGLAVGAAPLLIAARRWPARRPVPPRPAPGRALTPRRAVAFSALGLLIAVAPARPLDVTGRPPAPALPSQLDQWHGTAVAASPLERSYFTRYGGRVQKMLYRDGRGAPFVALAVTTTAPLRHLHDPDRCLTGAGHRVHRLGVLTDGTVLWRSVDPAGRVWRVETWLMGEGGDTATTVSEALWRWLRRPGQAWTLIERISPWDAAPTRRADFAAALAAALDRSPPPLFAEVHR